MIEPELKFKKPFQISLEEKKRILKTIKKTLESKENLLFAYLFGSFAEGQTFHDIDIALFGKEHFSLSSLIELSNLLESKIIFPVDSVDLRALSPGLQMEIFFNGLLLFLITAVEAICDILTHLLLKLKK